MTLFLPVTRKFIMDNQRLLLYLSLVFVLFLIWQAWQEQYAPKSPPSTQTQTKSMHESTAEQIPAEPSSKADVPQTAESLPATSKPSEQISGDRVRIVTDKLDLDISTQGGNILRSDLLTYPVSRRDPDIPFRLLDDQDNLYVAQSGLLHDKIPGQATDPLTLAPSHHAIFTTEKNEFRMGEHEQELQVPFVWRGSNGVIVKKIFTFHRDSFLIDIDHIVINEGEKDWIGRQYRQLRHGPINEEDQPHFIYTYTGSAYYDGKYEKLAFDDMADEPLKKEISGGWAAMLQHYFVSAWIPEKDERNQYYSKVVSVNTSPGYIIGLRSEPLRIAPGETLAFESQLYIGPKLQNDLGNISEGLELVTDFGIFTVISKPLFWLLDYINSWLGNWGWSIIVLTLLIKLVFYKLSETSYRSMAKMRAVQPRLLSLKERYAGDKQKMNQALMELYKKEKINPLGGCLPIVIQIPVFISLYWALLESVELRQAPFILWIQDLSTKDPYFVLPLLMGVTMVIQQKLNPTPLDPVQAKVMMVLPIVFTVFFAFFPAGLVLYWFTNNLLSIAQQWVIIRRVEQATH
jgi:YidC/Oxa1 family membrane protein insertase